MQLNGLLSRGSLELIVYRGLLLLSLVLPSQMATAQESKQLLISPVQAVLASAQVRAYLAVSAAQASYATVSQRADSCMNSYADPDLL